jgi:hypothetical protein
MMLTNEQYLHRMTWYTGTCSRTAMSLLYMLKLWSQRLVEMMFDLESSGRCDRRSHA